MSVVHSTTVLGVKRGEQTALAADGQVTVEKTVLKHTANKLRRIYGGRVVVGFAGAAADAISLFEKFEGKLEAHSGNLRRAAYELAKDWRTDRVLRRLEAMMVVADREAMLILSGTGEIIEPDDGIAAIGSGGPYAQAAAKALVRNTELPAEQIARAAMEIASEICIYTNNQINVEVV